MCGGIWGETRGWCRKDSEGLGIRTQALGCQNTALGVQTWASNLIPDAPSPSSFLFVRPLEGCCRGEARRRSKTGWENRQSAHLVDDKADGLQLGSPGPRLSPVLLHKGHQAGAHGLVVLWVVLIILFRERDPKLGVAPECVCEQSRSAWLCPSLG